jgi:hypothetical protein
MRNHLRSLATILLAAAALAATTAGPLVSADQKRAAQEIAPELLRAHIRFLSSDLLEGRGPATRGDRLGEAYVQSQMESLGIQPGAPGGGWIQKVPLVGIQGSFSGPAVFRSERGTAEGRPGENLIAVSGVQEPAARVENAEIVFVGYGIVDPEGALVKVDPCFDFATEGDLLRKKDIPWAYYSATNTQLGYIWSAYSAIGRYRDNQALWTKYMRPVDDVVRDIKADRLPAVTWITPRFQLSQHPEYNFCCGQNWTISVIDAIMRSPMWKDTAIFLTWDDWGGFYDHVPPVRLDRFDLGIRVPMVTISPYAKTGYIDGTLGEFSSVLRFIENNWGLTQLTRRDRIANDMSYNFDFTQPPRPPTPQPLRTDCKGPIWEAPPPD